MAFDLGAGRKLVLAGTDNGLAWLIVGAIALLLIAILYRTERRLVSRRAGLALVALRVAAALALVTALFEPIAARTLRESARGRLIVGVDLSDSMATPDVPTPDGRPAVSRREAARRLVAGPWLDELSRKHDVELVGFAREAAPARRADLARLLARPTAPDDPAGRATDWEPVLERALAEGTAPVVGVVLLTDGRRTATGPSGRAGDRLAARGLPAFGVWIGSADPPPDAAIAAVRAPETAFQGDVASVAVEVKADGYPAGTDLEVSLAPPVGEPLRRTVKAPGPGGARPVATFALTLEQVGPQRLVASVAPPGGYDLRPDNDRRSAAVLVADDKARVLLIEAEARWEFRYLRNALARDRRVEVDAVVLGPPPAPESAEPTYKGELPAAPAAGGDDPLGAFDAIVVGDLPPEATPDGLWERLDRYVAERGGTLIVAAGPRAGPAVSEVARGLLPVLDPRPLTADPTGDDPARPALPGGAAVAPVAGLELDPWPMLRLAGGGGEGEGDAADRAAWASLPRLPWALAGRAKPGAAVLLAAVTATADAEPPAVVAAQPYGLGKVLWVGTDGTWRWRYKVGDLYHHRFWGQAVRWATAARLAAGNRWVRFGPERPRAAEGEPVPLRARFADDAPGIGPDLLVAARIFRAVAGDGGRPEPQGDPVAVVPLRPEPGRPRSFVAAAPGLPEGRYLVRLDAPQLAEGLRSAGLPGADAPAPTAALEVSEPDTPERVELAATRDELDRLATSTGGRVVPWPEADALIPGLAARTLVRSRTEETPLWDTPWGLGLFFALLTAEWALRKRVGLP